jgi:hypothetical protein
VAARAGATVVVAKDFAALCAEADLIFVGTVTDVASRWADPSRQAIETLVTFGELTWLRGGAQPSVTLRFAGGTVDGLHEEIAGVPQFVVGERRMIFARAGAFVSPIVGFDQGALRVIEHAGSAAVVVGAGGPRPPRDGAEAPGNAVVRLTPPHPATSDQHPAAREEPVPLDEFLDRVRRELAQPSRPSQ